MNLHRNGSLLSREERNKINENWSAIEDDYNNVVEVVSDKAFDKVVDSAKLNWKEPVNTYDDLPDDAEQGETRMVRKNIDGVAKVYRFNNGTWEYVQDIDVTAINEVDRRFTRQLAQTMIPIATISHKLSNGGMRVKLIGDSITAGRGGTGYSPSGERIFGDHKVNESGHCWANSLKEYLESNLGCTVKNYGIAGFKSGDIVTNINSLVDDIDDLIICMIGTNNRNDTEGINSLINDIDFIYNHVTGLGKEIIFMSSIPASSTDESSRLHSMLEVDNAIMYATSQKRLNYISLYKEFVNYVESRNLDFNKLLNDGLHPNDVGYDIMYYLVLNSLGLAINQTASTGNLKTYTDITKLGLGSNSTIEQLIQAMPNFSMFTQYIDHPDLATIASQCPIAQGSLIINKVGGNARTSLMLVSARNVASSTEINNVYHANYNDATKSGSSWSKLIDEMDMKPILLYTGDIKTGTFTLSDTITKYNKLLVTTGAQSVNTYCTHEVVGWYYPENIRGEPCSISVDTGIITMSFNGSTGVTVSNTSDKSIRKVYGIKY